MEKCVDVARTELLGGLQPMECIDAAVGDTCSMHSHQRRTGGGFNSEFFASAARTRRRYLYTPSGKQRVKTQSVAQSTVDLGFATAQVHGCDQRQEDVDLFKSHACITSSLD